jgi:hypothetical protein
MVKNDLRPYNLIYYPYTNSLRDALISTNLTVFGGGGEDIISECYDVISFLFDRTCSEIFIYF